MRPRLTALLIALLISGAAAVIVYSPGFDAPMYYDSVRIEMKAHVFANGGLMETLRIFPQRPLAMASFYLDYVIAGMSARYFRFVNVLLLTGGSFLVSLFIHIGLKYAGASRCCSPAAVIAVSTFCGLVFLFHPVQIFVVEYIWQRMALLACVFFLAASVVYFADWSDGGKSGGRRFVTCFVLFSMAMACKETAVTLPIILVLAEIAFRKERAKDMKKTIAFSLLMLSAAIVYASFVERPHGAGSQAGGLVHMIKVYYAESGITILQALITQCRMIWLYLQLIILPLPSQLQLISPQEISQGIFEPVTSVFAVAGAFLLALCGVYLLHLRRLSGFGILFFLVTLSPEAVLVPQYAFLTYRASMPMIGILFVAADCATLLIRYLEGFAARRLLLGCFAGSALLALVFLGAVSYVKANWWANGLNVWGDIVKQLPEDLGHIQKDGAAQAFNNLGAMLSAKGNFDEAIRVHEKALKLIPADQYAYNNLGLAYMSKKEYEPASANFNRAIELNPYYAEAHYNLGRSFAFQGKTKEAAERFNKTIALNPNYWQAYNDLGVILAQEGQTESAIELFQAALSINPDYRLARQNLLGILTRPKSKPVKAFP